MLSTTVKIKYASETLQHSYCFSVKASVTVLWMPIKSPSSGTVKYVFLYFCGPFIMLAFPQAVKVDLLWPSLPWRKDLLWVTGGQNNTARSVSKATNCSVIFPAWPVNTSLVGQWHSWGIFLPSHGQQRDGDGITVSCFQPCFQTLWSGGMGPGLYVLVHTQSTDWKSHSDKEQRQAPTSAAWDCCCFSWNAGVKLIHNIRAPNSVGGRQLSFCVPQLKMGFNSDSGVY